MKTRFNSYDVVCITAELQKLVGLRVNQIYDIDNKTYLIKLQDKDVKQTLLFESGIRFHTTAFEWPKNPSPSGFTMKLRKHLKNKRLESLKQMGTDRIIDFQFGMGDATYHLILELYDRGNLILCDHEMTILNVLRPHTEGEEVRFVVREKYPESRARENTNQSSEEIAREILANIKSDDNLLRTLVPVLDCGPTVLMHVLFKRDLHDVNVKKNVSDENATDAATATENESAKGKKKKKEQKNDSSTVRYFDECKDFPALVDALDEAREFMKNANRNDNHSPHGFIIQKTVEKPSAIEGGGVEEFYYNTEYHPYLFDQYTILWKMKYQEFPSFDAAVDEFYSTLIGQKIDLKTYQQECEALKKLSNVKKDHEKRLEELNKAQVLNKQRAELISRNHELINSVLVTMRSAIANQMSWADIKEFVKNAQAAGDYVANSIKQLKLETNHVALYLTDPYASLDKNDENDDYDDVGAPNANAEDDHLPPMVVDIDLALSAYANATRYYDQKRSAANKETRTKESSTKALKNAERKTQEHLKEVRTISNISKARKVFWFEKFYWFISSENYLVIGGRDQQQNELIVKRYLRPNDVYVHADIQGASSIVIRNPYMGNASDPAAAIPPKTLLEAGAMAISYSVAWDAKVTTSAYWVRAEQVSKTAPTGEYLETGSFMIRGKKNFLPPCHLILGLSIMFKLEESSIPRHAAERCVRTFDDDAHKKYELEVEAESVQSEDLNQASDEAKAAENESDSTDSDDDGPSGFPDTHIKINSQVSTESAVERISESNASGKGDDDDDGIGEEEGAIIHAAPQQMPRKNRVIQKAKGKHGDGKKKQQKQQQQQQNQQNQEEDEKLNQKSKSGNALKRGQKSKLKKIKEKYKDQDEEEKQMRMEILKSAGKKKVEAPTKETEMPETIIPKRNPVQREKKPQPQDQPSTETGADLDVADDDDVQGDNNDTDMLNSLTGCPVEEDELLFALPVVAPYNALHNYKFKVKITPGTGRRGKTTKTAFAMFLKEKGCSNQEKDLIKAIKPDTAARNMPGKVKLSAPQMQRLRN